MKRFPTASINFNPVGTTVRSYKSQIIASMENVINRGLFLGGQAVFDFEKDMQHFLGGEGWVTSVASGHDALFLALGALGLNHSDEVIVPVNAYPSAFPVVLSRAKLVLADVSDNGQLDPEKIEEMISPKTKVIIMVHLYGLIGDVKRIVKLAHKHKIVLIEDCAQSFGSRFEQRLAGTFGDISCFSFYPTKNLGALGDGGAIWTKHKKYHKFFKQAVSYGEKERYRSLFIAGHSRLPELQAAALSIILKNFPDLSRRRKRVREWYEDAKSTMHLNNFLKFLNSQEGSRPVIHLLVARVKNRNDLRSFLKSKNIETAIHYPYPIHFVPAFSFLKHKRGDFPMAEKLSQEIVSLPFHPYLRKKDVWIVMQTIKKFYES